jgi:hypothetical protein
VIALAAIAAAALLAVDPPAPAVEKGANGPSRDPDAELIENLELLERLELLQNLDVFSTPAPEKAPEEPPTEPPPPQEPPAPTKTRPKP